MNPMAAYALSRYNMRGQYKILLFLIATMAFPPVVTMIPTFLLLREFHASLIDIRYELYNWFHVFE